MPPFDPAQVHVNGPDPETADAVPEEHRPVDGAEYVPTPFADPHTAFTRSGAEQDAFVPPFTPLQFQLHGPDPLTAVAVPVEQRLDDGADVTPTPFAEPQTPFCNSGAEHDALVPPFAPLQFHVHGPAPLTAVAVPDEQRFELGADVVPTPFADPHTAFTRSGAEQDAFVPPFAPLQFHVHGPVPLTAVALPDEQRLELGALIVPTPFELPHAPLTAHAGLAFEQFAFDPPPDPLQVHVLVVPHAVAPLSPDTLPDEHAPGLPHTPFTTQAAFAFEQLSLVPPPEPLHVHVRVVPHAVAPLSPDTDPVEHAPAVEPHAPFTGGLLHAASVAQKLAIEPLQEIKCPLHAAPVHVLEPVITSLLLDGQVKSSTSQPVFLHGWYTTEPPHPLSQVGAAVLFAEQDAFVPPPDPLQLHVHGPDPLTADAVPAEQRLVDGADANVPPCELPHAPLTGGLPQTTHFDAAQDDALGILHVAGALSDP